MNQPTHSDLGIQIGKALAMAEMAQNSIQNVEKHLSDRVDRFELKVDSRFEEFEKKFENAVSEIKSLIQTQHSEITDIKIQNSHDEGERFNKKENQSYWFAIWALVISFIGAIANFFSNHN